MERPGGFFSCSGTQDPLPALCRAPPGFLATIRLASSRSCTGALHDCGEFSFHWAPFPGSTASCHPPQAWGAFRTRAEGQREALVGTVVNAGKHYKGEENAAFKPGPGESG